MYFLRFLYWSTIKAMFKDTSGGEKVRVLRHLVYYIVILISSLIAIEYPELKGMSFSSSTVKLRLKVYEKAICKSSNLILKLHMFNAISPKQ